MPMSGPAIAGFVSALLPPEYGGPEPGTVAAQVERYLDQMPRPAATALRTGFVALAAYARLSAGRALPGLDVDRRERVLDRLAARTATADALEGLKAVVLLVAGAEDARPTLAARVASTGVARADPALDVTPAGSWASLHRCDAIVIGSGAGGAMVARTLARAGMETVVVEEGRRFGVAEFREGHPLERFAALYRDAGATAAFGRPPVVLPIGRGVGGTTLVNSGTCYRTPTSVLLGWRDRAGFALADPERFGPYLDEVEATLRVAPVPAEVMGRNGELLLAGAAALGWRAGPLRRNAPGCGGCCQCAIGCPRNAKLGVHLNALPEACAAGARILSEARVERV
ncbi:MAG: GMC family oxidoreductase N-terminal domain-containing protein, partial [Acidimicrobiales bacterium]